MYRIPDGTSAGVKTSLTQYNRITGEEHTARIYRNQIFQEIQDYLHKINHNKEVIITGDLNQSIGHRDIQLFFRLIGVKDIFQHYHNCEWEYRDTTSKKGNHCIDTIAATNGIL